ncbi:hypothetical protein B0H15DRAFT_799151 [Mycena belliarum]|uniref:Uncharacterized protein n=1 Tax=Mycena belliarum TaxID=1033014 RepID=A0AAD6UCR2_9AGAR|nr:hypothetical protein B0H15DRAFT_799151 [Mycena belliae]
MNSGRCPVPFYVDPGAPDGPLPGQKIYLVTGRGVDFPGAYVSCDVRPSADAQYKGVRNATLKSYTSWAPLEAAWFAGCDRGEHSHPTADEAGGDGAASAVTLREPPRSPTIAPPSSAPSSSPSSPTARSPHRSSHAPPSLMLPTTPPPSPRRPCVSDAHPAPPLPSLAPPSGIAGKMAYAVRHSSGGAVFDDYSGARQLYHSLQAKGESPALSASPSLTEGVCFAEGLVAERASAARRRWIVEEHMARAQNVATTWQAATDEWRERADGVWVSASDDEDSVCAPSLLLEPRTGGFQGAGDFEVGDTEFLGGNRCTVPERKLELEAREPASAAMGGTRRVLSRDFAGPGDEDEAAEEVAWLRRGREPAELRVASLALALRVASLLGVRTVATLTELLGLRLRVETTVVSGESVESTIILPSLLLSGLAFAAAGEGRGCPVASQRR